MSEWVKPIQVSWPARIRGQHLQWLNSSWERYSSPIASFSFSVLPKYKLSKNITRAQKVLWAQWDLHSAYETDEGSTLSICCDLSFCSVLLSKSRLQVAMSTWQDLILTSSSCYIDPLQQLFVFLQSNTNFKTNFKLKLTQKMFWPGCFKSLDKIYKNRV